MSLTASRYRLGLLLAAPVALAFTAVPNARAALILRYEFDDQANPTADSGTAPAAPGTLIGANSTYVNTTPSGTGFAYSTGAGNNDFVTTGTAANPDAGTDPAKLDGLTSFTLAFWVNLRAAPVVNDRFVSDGFNPGFDLRIGTPSGTNFPIGLQVDSTFVGSTASTSADQLWRFIAVTYDGTATTSNALFYTGTTSTALSQLGDPVTLNAGAVDPNTNDFQVGGTTGTTTDRSPSAWFDDVRVYNEVLDAATLEGIRQSNVPEPASAATLLGVVGLLALRRRGSGRQR